MEWFTELEEKFELSNPWSIAEALQSVAVQSPDTKKQVGALIFDFYGNIIASGYNQSLTGFDVTDKDWNDKTWKTFAIVHAEHQALINLQHYKHSRIRPPYAMIVTHTPCEQCCKLLCLQDIRHVHIIQHESRRQNSVDFLRQMGFNVSISRTDV